MDEREAELQEWCQALGHYEKVQDDEGEYTDDVVFVAGQDAKDALKGLEHLLRRDAPEQQPLYVRVGEWQTVRTHLLPLLQESPALDPEVAYRAVKVLVRLTLPLAPIVENKVVRLEHMQQYKVWMLEGNTLMTLMFLLSGPLAASAADRDDHQRNLLELGLTLIRNLLAVPDPEAAVNEYQRKLHDRCIVQMHESLVLETLTILASSIDSSTETSTKYLLQECFAHVYRQEKNAEDLLGDHGQLLAEMEAQERQQQQKQQREEEESKEGPTATATPKSGSKGGSASKPSKSASHASITAASSLLSSEAARLSANLAATLAAHRVNESALSKTGLARHARFASKYSVRVVAGSEPSHAVSVGPDGEKLAASLPRVTGGAGGTQVFATRFVRNPFGSSNQNRMVTDSMAARSGKKPVLGNAPRTFLNLKVKHALHTTACMLLDGGGYNALVRAMLAELTASTTKDLAISEDAQSFMQLSAFFMQFQRARSKAAVRAAEKVQRAKEKEEAARERKEAERIAKLEAAERAAREKQAAEDAALVAAAAAAAAPAAAASSSLSASQDQDLLSAEGASGLAAPAFPNAVDSQGRMTFESQVEGAGGAAAAAAPASSTGAAAAPASSPHAWPFGPDTDADDVDMTAGAAGAANDSGAAAAAAAAPPKKPFIRQTCFDSKPIGGSVNFDSWKYLNSRVKLCIEDKPTPWAHLAAAVQMYRELVRCIYEMHFYGDASTRTRADALRKSLFYDRESVEMFAKLIGDYKSTAASPEYLADLVVSAHYQMRLLEDLARGEPFTILEKRRRIVRRKKPKSVKVDIRNKEDAEALRAGAAAAAEEEPGARDGDASPSAAASKSKAKIRAKARLEEGARLLGEEKEEEEEERGSSLFPALSEDAEGGDGEEDGGRPLSAIEAAAKALKASKALSAESEAATAAEAAGVEEGEDEDEYEDVVVEEDSVRVERRESEFDFTRFLMRFARPDVVAHYLELLSHYRTLPLETATMILEFFTRLSAAHLDGFFFQLSAFVLFERVLTDAWLKALPGYDPLRSWIKGITRKFLDLACKSSVNESTGEVVHPNRHYWVEILFWKNMLAADKLLNEHGWFDSSRDRARSMADAEMIDDGAGGEEDGADVWVDVDEEEEEAKAAERARQEEAKLGGEAELSVSEWVDTESSGRVRARPWTGEEDALLRDNYPLFAELDSVIDILHSMLPLRTPAGIKDRLKKLELLQKRAPRQPKDKESGGSKSDKSKSSSSSSSGRKGSKKDKRAKLSLAEILDRHGVYKRVPPIDEVMDSLRELVVELVQKDCRSTLAATLSCLKVCRDQRAALAAASSSAEGEGEEPEQPAPFDFECADRDALEQLETMFKIMGIRDQDEREGAWTVPPYYSAKDLDEYIGMLEATLDSPAASAPPEEEVENDEAISRLLSSSRGDEGAEKGEGEGEQQQEEGEKASGAAAASTPSKKREASPEEDEAAQRKAAKRARREAKQLKEALELSEAAAAVIGSPSQQSQSQQDVSRPRRRRQDEMVAERMQREREAIAARRAREAAADDEAEAQYVVSSETAVGAAAVAAAQAAESQLSSAFAKKDLNDFMAQKRKRTEEAFAKRIAASSSATTASPAASRRHRDAVASPPKKAKSNSGDAVPGKRRLRRAAADSDEEEEEVVGPTPSQEEEPSAPTAEDAPMPPAADVDAAEAEDDEEEGVGARAAPPKKKHSARRHIQSDEEEEGEDQVDATAEPESEPTPQQEGEGEGERAEGEGAAMDMDDDAPEGSSTSGAVDSQAATQTLETSPTAAADQPMSA